MAAPVFAPFAARWDAEADRRRQLRTPEHLKALIAAQREHNAARSVERQAQAQRRIARNESKNPLSSARRAARTADKAARTHRQGAKADLKAARRNYPDTLTRVAAKAHAVHAVPAAVTTYAMSTPADWTMWPALTSAALIAANAGALWLGRRKVTVVVDDGASAEERQLLERLHPTFWVEHAHERGLGGTVTTPPALEAGGIRCEIRLDGTWTVKTLADKADSIRALLGARTALRMRITSASRGGWAVLTLATRSAAADVSSLWTPDRIPADRELMSLGVDIETGEEVLIPYAERLLVSGASGTGKSWSTRPLMATAHMRGDMVLIDGKGEESIPWEGICRTANEPTEIDAVVDESWAEMIRRKAEMKKRGISVWDGRQLTVFIDEGQVVLARIMGDKPRLQRLVELSSLGRSRGVVLWWATQYPVVDGSAPGLHKMIAPNLLTRFSLRVATTTQSGVALDDCADYAPHQIPQGKEWRGHGYLKGYGPRLIRTWTLDDNGVRRLPKSVWSGSAPTPEMLNGGAAPATTQGLRLVKAEAAPAASVPAPRTEAETAVLDAVRAAGGPVRQKDLVDKSGLAKGTVSKTVTRLVESGELVKAADGTITAAPSAGEVSA
ncbi:MarR family transcriptional regulator [Streptomyces sp. NPDC048623]|uniref:MarR family transcriptional regulator n=1 Tax=Streptomyces sp. NPDC048623 TaxID=3155761 RepID=UPI003417EEB5